MMPSCVMCPPAAPWCEALRYIPSLVWARSCSPPHTKFSVVIIASPGHLRETVARVDSRKDDLTRTIPDVPCSVTLQCGLAAARGCLRVDGGVGPPKKLMKAQRPLLTFLGPLNA